MPKKASKSKKSRSSSSSPTYSKTANREVSSQRMVLRIRSSENMKRSSQQSYVLDEKKKRTKSASKGRAKPKKKKAEKFDHKMPKKPPTAFFFFLEDFRKEFQEQNPDVKSMRDIGKACGEKWKTMTYEGVRVWNTAENFFQAKLESSVLEHVFTQKVKYYDIATEKRAEFESAMKEYIKKKESGEFEESEDEP